MKGQQLAFQTTLHLSIHIISIIQYTYFLFFLKLYLLFLIYFCQLCTSIVWYENTNIMFTILFFACLCSKVLQAYLNYVNSLMFRLSSVFIFILYFRIKTTFLYYLKVGVCFYYLVIKWLNIRKIQHLLLLVKFH